MSRRKVTPKKVINYILAKAGVGNLQGVIWKKAEGGPGFDFIYRKSANLFAGIPIEFTDLALNRKIEDDSRRWSIHEEFVLRVTDVTVEPERCIGISAKNTIVRQTTILPTHYPSFMAYHRHKPNAKVLDRAVVYGGYTSTNFFHHIVDAVNRLYMLEKVELPPEMPFIINRACYESPFVQHLRERSEEFRAINWLIQEPHDWYSTIGKTRGD
jgi:hypothetical protein